MQQYTKLPRMIEIANFHGNVDPEYCPMGSKSVLPATAGDNVLAVELMTVPEFSKPLKVKKF